MSKFCTNCGYECADDSAFCGNCGSSFSAQPVTEQPEAPVYADPAPAAEPQTEGTYYAPAPAPQAEGTYYNPAPQAEGTYYAPAPAPAPKKKNGALIAVIIGAVVIICVLLGIIIFGGSNSDPEASYPIETPAPTPDEPSYEAPSEEPSYGYSNDLSSGTYYAFEAIYDSQTFDADLLGLSGSLTIYTYDESFYLDLTVDGENSTLDGEYIFYEQDGDLRSYFLYAGDTYFGAMIYDVALDTYYIQVDETDIILCYR